MKASVNIENALKVLRRYQLSLLFVFTSFFLMGGCGDEGSRNEIPADEVATTAMRAEVIPA